MITQGLYSNLQAFDIFEKKYDIKLSANHFLIFGYIYGWLAGSSNKRKYKDIDEDRFYWVNYDVMRRDMPGLHLKSNRSITNYVRDLIDANILLQFLDAKNNNATYFCLTQEAQKVIVEKNYSEHQQYFEWDKPIEESSTEQQEKSKDTIENDPEISPTFEDLIEKSKATAEVVEPEIMEPYQEEVEKLYNELKKYNPNMDPPRYKKDCTQFRLLAKKVGEELFQSVLAWYILHLKDEDIYMPVAQCATSFRKKFDQIYKKMKRDQNPNKNLSKADKREQTYRATMEWGNQDNTGGTNEYGY